MKIAPMGGARLRGLRLTCLIEIIMRWTAAARAISLAQGGPSRRGIEETAYADSFRGSL